MRTTAYFQLRRPPLARLNVAFASLLAVLLMAAAPARAQSIPTSPAVQPGVMPGISTVPSTPSQTPNQQQQPATTNNGAASGNTALLYPGEDFQLGPGDLITVRVFGSLDYLTTVRIDNNGNVELPYIGSVHLQTLTVHQAQQLIAERLRTGGYFINPEVILQVSESINSSVTIEGEVRSVVPMTGARRLIDVLAAAGGLPLSASHTVKILRPGANEPMVLNLGPDLTNSAATSTLVFPRDVIQVSRAGAIYVIGAFRTQGSLAIDQSMPLTLLQVAALSGGVGYEGKYNDLRLIRTYGNDRKFVQVDIKKILNGKAPDPILQANDIVYLPTNQLKAAAKSLGIGGVIGLVSLVISLRGSF